MNRQARVLFEAPLAHEHASHCNCRECRNNFAQAIAPGWAESEWEAGVGPNLQKGPLAVPPGNPVPFATPPQIGYWPIMGVSKKGRIVSYKANDGSIEGQPGRMFLGNRKGRGDKAGVPRWHVGVDLFANIGDVIVACEDGTIVEFAPFYPAKSGQMTYRLLIKHSTAVVNYGEVTKDSLTRNQLRVGMRVRAGQPVAFVSDTSMLHFETYIIGTTRNYRWWKNGERPRQLLNPTRYLFFLKEHGLPQQASVSQPSPSPSRHRLVRRHRNSAPAFPGGWTESEWEALVGPNPQVNLPIVPPARQQPVHHRRNPALALQPPLPPLTTPALSTPTKWMGSKPPGTTLYVNIPLGSEDRGTTPMTGIFLPKRYRSLPNVDILLYLHGYKIAPNQPDNRWSVDWYWQNGPIGAFRGELNNSYKNVVLVMPTLSRKSNPGWLVRPGGLDRYLDMVMAALSAYGPYQGKYATVGNIILAGHSGAGLYMRKLARSKQRYSPLIRECWGFDCMYNGDDADEWSKWARQNPKAKLYNYYIRGTLTKTQSEALPKLPNISVTPLNNRPYRSDLHHWVPITYWRTRIEQAPFLLNI